MAIARAAAEGIPLVLGSATPSLESWHRARRGEYTLVEMPRRVLDRPMPAVGTIDLRGAEARGGAVTAARSAGSCTPPITAALDEGGQVILLLNRAGLLHPHPMPGLRPRGAMPALRHRPDAPSHGRDRLVPLLRLRGAGARRTCPACDFAGIRYWGLGTQRLEAEVRARFPDVACLRMDTDTMQAHGSHERALAAFRAGKVRILLGTQMIAKGLDFPNVTLVGVINADTALHLPDFRAAERTFHLVTQVAGRTGRGPKGGRVLVQTFSPDHPAIQAAVRHDYAAFAAGELPIREMLRYPPFASMIRLVIRGPVEPWRPSLPPRSAGGWPLHWGAGKVDARVLGPAPARLPGCAASIASTFRSRARRRKASRGRRRSHGRVQPPAGVQWIVDVDPVEML